MNEVIIKAPAKINLTLDILPKKMGDEFHLIETIFHKINLYDELIITAHDRFEIEGNFDCPMKENLIYKAWILLAQFLAKKDHHPVKVIIKKNIPMGGGLGGGSSDFAAFIKGYFRLFDLGEIPKALIKASADNGKDIPFFLEEKVCALGTHYGEVIKPVPFPEKHFQGQPIYLYVPNFHNNTHEMYKKLVNFNTMFTKNFCHSPNLNNCGNGFDCFFDRPDYQVIDPQINRLPICMSGSGSCFFSFEKILLPKVQMIETNL